MGDFHRVLSGRNEKVWNALDSDTETIEAFLEESSKRQNQIRKDKEKLGESNKSTSVALTRLAKKTAKKPD